MGLKPLHQVESARVAAVYWEFDIDNDWQSAFFTCRSYRPEADQDDEWAADFDESEAVVGPSQPILAVQRGATWDRDMEAIGRNLFAIARTVASFGRAAATWDLPIPLCAGYHDQDVVFRISGT